jgi:hypothetical protein
VAAGLHAHAERRIGEIDLSSDSQRFAAKYKTPSAKSAGVFFFPPSIERKPQI